jgi:hypothetical protein
MAKMKMKPLFGALCLTTLSVSSTLGLATPAFADAVAPVVTVTSTCPTQTILATLAPGQILQGFVVTTGPAAGFTQINDTALGFSQNFPTSLNPAPFTISGNVSSTVTACVFNPATVGIVTLQVLGPSITGFPSPVTVSVTNTNTQSQTATNTANQTSTQTANPSNTNANANTNNIAITHKARPKHYKFYHSYGDNHNYDYKHRYDNDNHDDDQSDD